jgi:cytochrome b561
MLKNTPNSYGSVAKFFHWTISVAVFTMLIIGFLMGEIKNEATAGQFYDFHKSLGLTIFAILFFRLSWRLINPNPSLDNLHAWERILSRLTHFLLYILLFALPFSGWLMSTASGYVPEYFGWFSVPMPFVPVSKTLSKTASKMHEFFAWSIIVLLCLHIAGALKHHFIDKDNILRRMLPGKSNTI